MPKNGRTSRILGRGHDIEPQELVRRYAALRRFLEDNWGRIGQRLPKVRTTEDVKSVLSIVGNAKWSPAFRDFPTGCLLQDGAAKVGWRELRETRERRKEALDAQGRLSLEFHNADQAAQNARTALTTALAEYLGQQSKESQRRLKEIGDQLRLEELRIKADEISAAYRAAQQKYQFLEGLLQSQEGWFARNEVVGFVRDPKRRYRKTPDNFAKAMAGLPFYDWLYSIRKCLSIPETATVRPTYWFQVFGMLKSIVKTAKPANLTKIELKLKNKLMRSDTDPLRFYISPQWHYMTLAFAECRGKKLRRTDIPFRIMEKFLDHVETPSDLEAKLAKYNQLPGNFTVEMDL